MAEEGPAFDDFADYYDMADIDRIPETTYYCNLIGKNARSLLELACGTGTVTIPMAKRLAEGAGGAPVRVVGLDVAEKMLVIARRNAPEIEWLNGDMRAPAVTGPFDVIVCCFHSYQLLTRDEDLLQAFTSARDLLSKDGIFAFSIYQPNLAFLNAQHTERTVRTFDDAQGRTLEVREWGRYDATARVLETHWRLVPQGAPDAEPLAQMHVFMRQYFADEIERLLQAAGLVIRERYGNYDRSPFTPQSIRQVIVCGRA